MDVSFLTVVGEVELEENYNIILHNVSESDHYSSSNESDLLEPFNIYR